MIGSGATVSTLANTAQAAEGAPVNGESRVVKLDMNPAVSQKALLKGWNLIDSVPSKGSIAAVKFVVRDNTPAESDRWWSRFDRELTLRPCSANRRGLLPS